MRSFYILLAATIIAGFTGAYVKLKKHEAHPTADIVIGVMLVIIFISLFRFLRKVDQ